MNPAPASAVGRALNPAPVIPRTPTELAIAEAFAVARASLPGNDSVAAARAVAFDAFEAKGLPSRRTEAWRYTDLRALLRSAPPAAPAVAAAPEAADPLPGLDRARLVVLDGRYRPDLSDLSGLDGLVVSDVATLLAAGDERIGAEAGRLADPMVALNTAMMSGGVALDVPAGHDVVRAVEIAHVTSGTYSVFARNSVRVGAGASLRLVETFTGPEAAAYQSNVVTEAVIGDRAKLTWAKLQADGQAAVHIGTTVVSIGGESQLDHLTLMIGAAISRSQSFVTYGGEFARAGLFGATMVGGKQHADIMLGVDHAVPNGASRELFKAVMDGKAEGIFQGRIIVRPGAQKVDGKMMTQGLLLSEEASFSVKPELEIFADDVQCAHGATSGEIDEDMLFYLLSRGIPRAEAETLLVTAFLAEAIEGLGDEAIGEAFEVVARSWLAGRKTAS